MPYLLTLPEKQGLRLMALLNLLAGFSTPSAAGWGAAGGDALRSAANQIAIESSFSHYAPPPPENVVTLWMDEVISELEPSMTRLAAFITRSVLNEPLPSARVAALAGQLSSDEAASFARASRGHHVTSGKGLGSSSAVGGNYSSAEGRREALLEELESDPLFAEAFAVYRGAFGSHK